MRVFAFAVASATLLVCGSAAAQTISNIGYQAGSSYATPSFACDSAPCADRQNPLPEGEGFFPNIPGATGGAAYNSFVNVGADSIFFESSNATSQGPYNSFSSFSSVSFNVENDGPFNFHSEITPQGLGMYLADTSGGCVFTNSCAQVSDQIHQFSQLSALGEGDNGVLGAVGFSFEIIDNESTIYSLTGLLYMARNALGCEGFCIQDAGLGTGAPEPTGARSLTGFDQQTVGNDFSAIAFGWQATGVDLFLSGGFHAIEYRTSVFSYTNADCLGPSSSVCLLAYSGFGDPIGRGGGISASAVGAFDIGAQTHTEGELIGGLNFTPSEFRFPRFTRDGLTLDSVVPEPGTWALLIAGFGFTGAALRRRRIPAHI